jgi:predicted transcriptional regulator
MSHKEMVLGAISRLPDDCTFADREEQLHFMAAVQQGLDQVNRGEFITHEEVEKEMASWLSA